MRRVAAICLTATLAATGCTPYPPAGGGGMAEHGALPPGSAGPAEADTATRTMDRLTCLDQRYEALAARGMARRHPAAMALARDARRDALRWTAAGLARDGALAADRYAAGLARLDGMHWGAPC